VTVTTDKRKCLLKWELEADRCALMLCLGQPERAACCLLLTVWFNVEIKCDDILQYGVWVLGTYALRPIWTLDAVPICSSGIVRDGKANNNN
jgi:hypothetical protein